jgi:L-iditol 2-dehydrogenase
VKAARLYGFNDIRVEEVPVPRVGPGEALMATRASGICSGDVMPWYIERKAPLVLGHEAAGEIVQVGDGVRSFGAGQRVFVHHHAPCFSCPRCRRGDYVQCETWRRSRIEPGGLAEYVLIPEVNLENDTLLLPDSVSYEDGTLVEPLACVVKGLRRAAMRRGDTALVIGLGTMGVLHTLVLRKFGAGTVLGADRVPFRLARALELGADRTLDAGQEELHLSVHRVTGGEMAHLVVVGPGTPEALHEGLRCVAPGGTVLMFTPLQPGEHLTIEPNELYFRDVSIVTSYSAGPAETAEALELIAEGVVRAEMVVTHRFPLEEAARAYRLTAEARDSLKCLITFENTRKRG